MRASLVFHCLVNEIKWNDQTNLLFFTYSLLNYTKTVPTMRIKDCQSLKHWDTGNLMFEK